MKKTSLHASASRLELLVMALAINSCTWLWSCLGKEAALLPKQSGWRCNCRQRAVCQELSCAWCRGNARMYEPFREVLGGSCQGWKGQWMRLGMFSSGLTWTYVSSFRGCVIFFSGYPMHGLFSAICFVVTHIFWLHWCCKLIYNVSTCVRIKFSRAYSIAPTLHTVCTTRLPCWKLNSFTRLWHLLLYHLTIVAAVVYTTL